MLYLQGYQVSHSDQSTLWPGLQSRISYSITCILVIIWTDTYFPGLTVILWPNCTFETKLGLLEFSWWYTSDLPPRCIAANCIVALLAYLQLFMQPSTGVAWRGFNQVGTSPFNPAPDENTCKYLTAGRRTLFFQHLTRSKTSAPIFGQVTD